MVNTFLTSSDYKESAKNLDNARLGKQRVEAYQILTLIENLSLLSRLYNIPIPFNPYLRRDWIRRVVSKYNNSGKYLFYHQNTWVWISAKTKPYIPKSNENTIVQHDGSILVCKHTKRTHTKTLYPKFGVVLKTDRLITFGFVYHPAVLMWLCHNESLKEYINAHIEEWIGRGHKNTMKTYDIDISNNIKPIWVTDPEIHINHKAALYIKEIKRNEYPWYCRKPDFVEAGNHYLNLSNNELKNESTSDFNYYIWPFNTDDGRYQF